MGLWTYEHAVTVIPALVVMIIIAAVLRAAIGSRPLKVRMIPFQILSCVLVVLEIGKQITSLVNGYDLYCLPFHFCSLFIFMLPLMSFYKGKHRLAISGVTSALCASLFALMLIYPNLIYGAWNIRDYFVGYMDFHTVTFHNIVMLEFLLIIFLGLHQPEKKRDIKASMIFIVFFCVVSATMAQVLKTNYANYYTCNIPVFEALRKTVAEAIGAVGAQLMYILIVSALNLLFVFGSYWLYYLLCNVLGNRKKFAQQEA